MKIDGEPAAVDGASGGVGVAHGGASRVVDDGGHDDSTGSWHSQCGSGWTSVVEICLASPREERERGRETLQTAGDAAEDDEGAFPSRGRSQAGEAKRLVAAQRRAQRRQGEPAAEGASSQHGGGHRAGEETQHIARSQQCDRCTERIVRPSRGRLRHIDSSEVMRLMARAVVIGMGRGLSEVELARLPALVNGRMHVLGALRGEVDEATLRDTISSQAALVAVGLSYGAEAMQEVADAYSP